LKWFLAPYFSQQKTHRLTDGRLSLILFA